MIDFRTQPSDYKHWKISFEGRVAILTMDVQEDCALFPGYELKLNSYDLGVDIELYDAIQRLRFEHPEVASVLVTSAKDRVFSAGANIRMLGLANHQHKVNFCKFTNETRLGMEDASVHSGQTYLCAINGIAAGGGYELALAAEHLMLVDDGASAVSLPEVPLLAVLPGTGGLTRLIDKRMVRKDFAHHLCTTEEGVSGPRAVEWNLVDEVIPASRFAAVAMERAHAFAARSDRPGGQKGIVLAPLWRKFEGERLRYRHIDAEIDSAQRRCVTITVRGPEREPPRTVAEVAGQGADFYPLALARELDDLLLHLRFNHAEIGSLIFRSEGDPDLVQAYDALLEAEREDWLIRETLLYLKRTFKRIDTTSRSIVALVEPGSCFVGSLAEIVFCADRSFMLEGSLAGDNRPPAAIRLTRLNFGAYPMGNGLTRLASRFYGRKECLAPTEKAIGRELEAGDAVALGLVTFAFDDIDWDDELRQDQELRASLSPDALTGMEANLRFPGPETMETKIFGRLSAWQNWIFQRPNAAGDTGALKLYGSGKKAEFDWQRV